MIFIAKLRRSIAFYPLSGAWLGGMTILALLAGGYIDLGVALMAETTLVALLMLASLRQELKVVRHLVATQHDEQVAFNETVRAAALAELPISEAPDRGTVIDKERP